MIAKKRANEECLDADMNSVLFSNNLMKKVKSYLHGIMQMSLIF